jgi:hypothetical protein
LFVAAYNPSQGALAWETSFPSDDLIGALGVVSLSVDQTAGALYLTGAYATSITIGGPPHAVPGGAGSGFIAKLVGP